MTILPKATGMKFISAALLAAGVAGVAGAQGTAAAPSSGPGVGALAPNFSLPGATRYGVLRDPVNLADYHGQVVVLAFFFKARTKG
jgi:hypothetical protein